MDDLLICCNQNYQKLVVCWGHLFENPGLDPEKALYLPLKKDVGKVAYYELKTFV